MLTIGRGAGQVKKKPVGPKSKFLELTSLRPIFDRQSGNSVEIVRITSHDRCTVFQGDGGNPQIVLADATVSTPKGLVADNGWLSECKI